MIFFEHLFIVIAKFYINTWSKYKNWWVSVRYGITVLVLLNLLSVQAMIDNRMNKITFLSIFGICYLTSSFIYPKLNDKDFVKNYSLSKSWRTVSLIYIFGSITIGILTFWIFIVGI
ncbi:hypothetical protein SAMN06296241_0452 [Salinimicrobium sediminis]|uniref:Uncharacterized protein n=1 Tax=Salinimicrobium sediminis TaxID=1343891 RepID=A0A285X0U2_9FLAO|nr:hypothetical protein SAMN06296241_0452 [Salinimicrobium sediminis]